MTDFCALILNIVTLLNSYTNRPFTENNWALQSATFVLSPGVIVTVDPKKPIKNCFLICYSLVDLMDASHVGCQSWMFCGPVPSDEELSSENPDRGFKPFAAWREDRTCEFHPVCMALC